MQHHLLALAALVFENWHGAEYEAELIMAQAAVACNVLVTLAPSASQHTQPAQISQLAHVRVTAYLPVPKSP